MAERPIRRLAERMRRITHTPVNTDRIRQLAHCAADGAWSEFYMSIPPRPDHDADLVLSAAADEIDRLRAEIARLRADIAALKDPAKVLVNMMRGNIATPSPAALAGLFGANLTDLEAANLRISALREGITQLAIAALVAADAVPTTHPK